jgi:hypothetical protein
MFIQMILDHIPRTWKAAVALMVMITAVSAGLQGLTAVIVGNGQLSDWLRVTGGLVFGLPATYVFYTEQRRAQTFKSHEQIQAETLANAGKRPEGSYAHIEIKAHNLNNPNESKPDNNSLQ